VARRGQIAELEVRDVLAIQSRTPQFSGLEFLKNVRADESIAKARLSSRALFGRGARTGQARRLSYPKAPEIADLDASALLKTFTSVVETHRLAAHANLHHFRVLALQE
jgi:hypothetical protein